MLSPSDHQEVALFLLKGDSKKITALYQKGLAIIQMTRLWLDENYLKFSWHTRVGERLDKYHPANQVDKKSTQHCDTCVILITHVKSDRSQHPCHYDQETQTCQSCRALNRHCTFTQLVSLLAAWIGREYYLFDYKDYVPEKNGKIVFPFYGRGHVRQLVAHWGMPPDEIGLVMEIQELVGWKFLYSFLSS
ncbi:hypothetical protein N0V88_000857 [Collariella sp. IMI 366227]|nr:hypothetical protein N0V88_000857 [Collariella sp. IMI 366227]